MRKTVLILQNSIPVLIMIALIPFIANDYWLTGIYILIIILSFIIKRLSNEFLIFTLGFVIMIIVEYLFVSTGVETFERHSLFGIMPLWLPFLWGYGYVVIKRSTVILAS